ncbi:hypothetical protein D3C71_1866200 [compost metagenome]
MEAIRQLVAVALQTTTLFRGEPLTGEFCVCVSKLLLILLLPAGTEKVLNPA